MNERIREFREQAWTLVSNEERDRGALYDAREQWERCDQKFAELIVRECININKEELAFNAFERLFNRYQEHFGVEE